MDKETEAIEGAKGNYRGAIVAKILNISESRLRQLAREGVIPKAGHGLYPLAGAAQGYVNFLQRTSIGGLAAPDVKPDELAPFQRKAHYQAESEKLRIAERAGELISRTEVEAAMAQTAKVVSHFFNVLPDLLERDCGATPAMLAKLEEALDKVREQIYQEIIRDPEAGDAQG